MYVLNGIPAWELQDFLKNSAGYMRDTMSWIGIILGIVGLVWGFAVILKGLMSSNGQPTPWMKGLALIIIGGVMAFGSWKGLYSDVGKGMNKTITNMGGGNSKEAAPETILAGMIK